jgi:hypothetical protein
MGEMMQYAEQVLKDESCKNEGIMNVNRTSDTYCFHFFSYFTIQNKEVKKCTHLLSIILSLAQICFNNVMRRVNWKQAVAGISSKLVRQCLRLQAAQEEKRCHSLNTHLIHTLHLNFAISTMLWALSRVANLSTSRVTGIYETRHTTHTAC